MNDIATFIEPRPHSRFVLGVGLSIVVPVYRQA